MEFVASDRRVFLISLFLVLFIKLSFSFEVPDVKIQAFKPKGIRVSIPDEPGINLFVFQGNVNRAIGASDVGTLAGEIQSATRGQWTYENRDVQLKVGDVISYYVIVTANSAGYLKDKLSFTVRELEDVNQPSTPKDCFSSLTKVRGLGVVCAGQTIFEDSFDGNRIDEDVWQVEQYIPVNHPEFPFVSYQRASVSVADGYLHIKPSLQQDQPGFSRDSIFSGTLNLFSDCTGSADECTAQAWGASILPPIVSGRVTSKAFAFTYGTVHVTAKLPQGDWLYPEIILEPFLKKYGSSKYASGVLKVATALGNNDLKRMNADVGNQLLYGGPVLDFNCRSQLLAQRRLAGQQWGNEFHVYSVTWTPDNLTLFVDNQEYGRITFDTAGLRSLYPANCKDLPSDLLAAGSKMAPFDDHFYLTLGVAAGGITEFPDDSSQKPWKNTERKAILHFWQHQHHWYPSWRNPELVIDHVKVVAL